MKGSMNLPPEVESIQRIHLEQLKKERKIRKGRDTRKDRRTVTPADPNAIISLEPHIKVILDAILEPVVKNSPRQAYPKRMVYFLEKLARENPTVQSVEDRMELAEALNKAL